MTFTNPKLSGILLQKLALSLALYGWYAVIALYLGGQLGFTVVQTTQYFSIFALANVAINGFGVGKAASRFGDRTMSTLGIALLVAAFGASPFVHNVVTLTGVMLLFALGGAFAQNGITAMISNTVSDREQGTVLGVSSSLDSLSGIISPPLSTGLFGRYGAGYAGVESLAMAIVAGVLGLVAVRRAAPGAEPVTDIAPEPEPEPIEA